VSHVPERSKECEALSDDLIEFALGTLSGRSRSLVLDHLETCAHCNAESESLADVADTMLWLAPDAEPPLGFETRVIERFRGSEAQRRIVRRRRASVFAVAADAGCGARRRRWCGGDEPRWREFAFGNGAALDRSPDVGRTGAGRGHHLFRQSLVDDHGRRYWEGVGRRVVRSYFANGRSETVGKFTSLHGYGSWIAPIKASGSDVRSARIVKANGAVVAQATFTT